MCTPVHVLGLALCKCTTALSYKAGPGVAVELLRGCVLQLPDRLVVVRSVVAHMFSFCCLNSLAGPGFCLQLSPVLQNKQTKTKE